MLKKLKTKLIAWLLKQCGDLIYTSKGNLPVKDLARSLDWELSENGIALHETYTLNGEVVKKGVDVLKMPDGSTLRIEQGNL